MRSNFCRQLLLVKGYKSVGLESLPGELSPTPTIEHHISTIAANPSPNKAQFFDVNSFDTQDAVAKMMVNIFVQEVHEYLSFSSSSSSNFLWSDAGAGSGALLQYLPRNFRLGVDIAPSIHPEVVQANVLKMTRIHNVAKNLDCQGHVWGATIELESQGLLSYSK